MLAPEHQEAEQRFVEHLRSRFEDQGFTFEPYPDTARLPDFMAPYRPDAIARRGDQNVAIEVKNRQTPRAERSLRQIRRIFDGHADWQFRVVVMAGDPQDSVKLSTSTPKAILGGVVDTRALLGQGQRRAAFVAAWSLLEAAFRSLGEARDGLPATPGTVVQTLAMDGRITPETERRMRELIGLRNRVVHGDLDAEPTNGQVDLVLSAVESALSGPPEG